MSALFGHASAATAELAAALGTSISTEIESKIAVAIFAINAQTGIDQPTIDLWHGFDDYLIPRILLVTGFENGEQDFDDAILIARRVLDEVATPYLVLHDDSGNPAGLISLSDNKIFDYSTGEEREADSEHITLVSEFRDEYLNQLEGAGLAGFEAGIFFPAIPILLPKLGVDIAKNYIERVTKR